MQECDDTINGLVSESWNKFISIEQNSVHVECEFRDNIALTDFFNICQFC